MSSDKKERMRISKTVPAGFGNDAMRFSAYNPMQQERILPTCTPLAQNRKCAVLMRLYATRKPAWKKPFEHKHRECSFSAKRIWCFAGYILTEIPLSE